MRCARLTLAGKLRRRGRRGRFSGYRSDWKKAYVPLGGGREDAGVYGDLSHGCEDISSDNPDTPLHNERIARGHHKGKAGKVTCRRQAQVRRPVDRGGRVTSRFIGGGHKQKFREVDFRREKAGVPAKVAAIEYDPNRSARLALLHYADGEKRYILAPVGLEVGSTVSGPDADILVGNSLPFKTFPRYGGSQHRVKARQGWSNGSISRNASPVGFEGSRSTRC